MFRGVLLYLVGRLVTRDLVNHVLAIVFEYLKKAAEKTDTAIDDEALKALERVMDKEALADALDSLIRSASK